MAILKAHDAGTPTAELARKHGIHPNTLRQWRAKYGGMEVAKVRALTDENERLKRIVAELHLDNDAYKILVEKKRLGPSARKAAVRALQGEGVSEQRACKIVGCSRNTVRYRVRRLADTALLEPLSVYRCGCCVLDPSTRAINESVGKCDGFIKVPSVTSLRRQSLIR